MSTNRRCAASKCSPQMVVTSPGMTLTRTDTLRYGSSFSHTRHAQLPCQLPMPWGGLACWAVPQIVTLRAVLVSRSPLSLQHAKHILTPRPIGDAPREAGESTRETQTRAKAHRSIGEEDLDEAVVVNPTVEVGDGLGHHVMDLCAAGSGARERRADGWSGGSQARSGRARAAPRSRRGPRRAPCIWSSSPCT